MSTGTHKDAGDMPSIDLNAVTAGHTGETNTPAFEDTLGVSPEVQRDEDGIPSVNGDTRPKGKGKAVKSALIAGAVALGIGGTIWFGQSWATRMKEEVRAASKGGSGKAAPNQSQNLLNPEGSTTAPRNTKLGAAAAPIGPVGALGAAGVPIEDAASAALSSGIRPLRGADGKVMVNASGKTLGVDPQGNMVEVPALVAMGGESTNRKPLPDQATGRGAPTSGGQGGGAPQPKERSRFGGALHADEEKGALPRAQRATNADMGGSTQGGQVPSSTRTGTPAGSSTAAYTDVLNKLVSKIGGGDAPSGQQGPLMPTRSGGEAPAAGGGSVGGQLVSSATPMARARRSANLSLMLPKSRQIDCILTTRIINELPGFTSCITTNDLYGADGKVMLLERGSELTGEYGMSGQAGLRRLFVVWTRARTKDGVEIDLQSPGSDSLGTSGLPGHLEERWMERIGAALLLSVMKDTIALAMAREAPQTGVVVQQPGQGTIQAGQNIAEQVLRQTINIKPTLYINQGERISITVARDLDFSPVYALVNTNESATKGAR